MAGHRHSPDYDVVMKLLGFDEQVPFEMDREYLRPLFAFVTSRHTDEGNDMYDRWKDYHEQMLKPKYREDIETSITPDLYDALYEQVKARILAYIPELADHQDKPIAMLLFKAGVCKEIGKRQRSSVSVDNEVFDVSLNINLVAIKPFA